MRASNRTWKQPVSRAAQRSAKCERPANGERVFLEPPTVDGLKVTVRVIPLPEPESNALRARQLAVIVDLLRHAAAKAAEKSTTTLGKTQASQPTSLQPTKARS